MVSAGADDSDADSVALVPAGKAIDDVNSVPGVQVVDGALAVDSPDLLRIVSLSSSLSSLRQFSARDSEWTGSGCSAGRSSSQTQSNMGPNAGKIARAICMQRLEADAPSGVVIFSTSIEKSVHAGKLGNQREK
jgi:hypothetical protein